jgi:hypothetical protein
MKHSIRWHARNSKLAAKRAQFERQATALLRADARRRKATRQPKPKPTAPSSLPPVSSWMPLADLGAALRAKECRQRARR